MDDIIYGVDTVIHILSMIIEKLYYADNDDMYVVKWYRYSSSSIDVSINPISNIEPCKSTWREIKIDLHSEFPRRFINPISNIEPYKSTWREIEKKNLHREFPRRFINIFVITGWR